MKKSMVKEEKEKERQLLLRLIKGCENFDLTVKESIDAISDILNKNISRRTYYIYKKRLYNNEIFQMLKDTIYDTKEMKCLLLELEYDKTESLRANNLISEQFPDRKDIFHDTDKQMKDIERANEKIKTINDKFNRNTNSILLSHKSIPENATIREEFIKCGKDSCLECPHGPYYYAYWKDKTKDNKKSKLKKKYLGMMDPRH